MPRLNALGEMFRRSKEEGRQELLRVAAAHRGRVALMAKELGVPRKHLYRLFDREKLWEEIERIRKAEPPKWLSRTLEALE